MKKIQKTSQREKHKKKHLRKLSLKMVQWRPDFQFAHLWCNRVQVGLSEVSDFIHERGDGVPTEAADVGTCGTVSTTTVPICQVWKKEICKLVIHLPKHSHKGNDKPFCRVRGCCVLHGCFWKGNAAGCGTMWNPSLPRHNYVIRVAGKSPVEWLENPHWAHLLCSQCTMSQCAVCGARHLTRQVECLAKNSVNGTEPAITVHEISAATGTFHNETFRSYPSHSLRRQKR